MMDGRPSMISGMFMFTSLSYTEQPNVQHSSRSTWYIRGNVFLKTYRFFLEKVQSCLNVGPLLENPVAPLSFLSTQHTTLGLK